jgi:peptidoglycan hydrolase-like protein with peptidoglycan-binding domain
VAKSIHVDLENFVVSVRVDGEEVRRIDDCSFGRHDGDPNDLTPNIAGGQLSLQKRGRRYWSDQSSAWMPFSLFFAGDHDGCAFHAGNTFRESHGCVHLNPDDAEWLFNWAGGTDAPEPVALDIVGQHPRPGARVYRRVDSPHMLPRFIRRINQSLHECGLLGREPDETYDAETEAAVRKYQEARSEKPGLGVDGSVGENTAVQMGIAWSAEHWEPGP